MHSHSNGGSAYYYQQPRFGGTFPPFSSSTPPSQHYATSTILDDEPVWARADTIDPRQKSPPPHGYQPPSVRGATPQQMTVVHSSAKPVPDSDIYRYLKKRKQSFRKKNFLIELEFMVGENVVYMHSFSR